MADEHVVVVWSGTRAARHAYRVLGDGLVLGRALVEQTDDDAMSRNHARVGWRDGRLVVADLGSRNHTFVGGATLATTTAEVAPGAVIRTGRTVWVVVAERAEAAAIFSRVEAIVAAARGVPIRATLVERGLLETTRLPAPSSAAWCVFPSPRAAVNASRRVAAALSGATTHTVIGSNAVVEAAAGDRRVAITCPPSTALGVELFEHYARRASGFTITEGEAIEVAKAWLGDATIDALVAAFDFLRADEKIYAPR